MKKILFIILMFSGIAFSQTYYGIEDKPVFNTTAEWVSIDPKISLDLVRGVAEWDVAIYDADLNYLLGREIVFIYTGQAITATGQRTVTANELNLTYNGLTQ